MGLFSNRYKTYVGTTVTRVISDKTLPNSVKTGVLKGILQNGSLPEYAMEELSGSIGMRADRMYDYAVDNYTHGLPGGTIISAAVGLSQVTAVLRALHGADVTIAYVHMGTPNSHHWGWMQAIGSYGYDTATNRLGVLTAQKGKDVYLEDMVVVVPTSQLKNYEPDALEQWGTPASAGFAPTRSWISNSFSASMFGHTPVATDDAAAQDFVRLFAVWDKELTPGTFDWDEEPYGRVQIDIPITGPDAVDSADYVHVKYSVGGVTKYWMYRVGSGVHPTLDNLVTAAEDTTSTFFPFQYFRYGKDLPYSSNTSPEYLTSKRLAKHLSMDYDAVVASVEENPDIGDVEQAMIIMAVPANTTDPLEMRYLYEFFLKLYVSRGETASTQGFGAAYTLSGGNTPDLPRTSILIQDKKFKMVLSDAGLYRRRSVGTLGPVGTCTSGFKEESIRLPIWDQQEGNIVYQYFPIKHHYYRKQLSSFIYQELVVVDLQVMYQVLEKYATTADEEDDILLIPLDRSITHEYSITERETLYARSLHFVFNSSQVVKIKWYQSTWFQALMVFVAVALTIASNGKTWKLIVAAATVATVAAALDAVIAILMTMLEQLIYSYAFKLFIKVVGVDIAIVLAAVAFYYAKNSEFAKTMLRGTPWSEVLLKVSTGLLKAANDSVSADMQDLLKEYKSFELFKSEEDKALEASNKLLEHKNSLDPFVIFGETPNDFYNRTIHSGNIGMVSISAISSFVDNALKLPELSTTVGDSAYV